MRVSPPSIEIFTLRYIISTFEQNSSMLRQKILFVYWNADKMHEKELCNVIYIVAAVFRVNDFPCANNVRSIGEWPFQENKVCNYLSKINCIWMLKTNSWSAVCLFARSEIQNCIYKFYWNFSFKRSYISHLACLDHRPHEWKTKLTHNCLYMFNSTLN